MEKLNLASYGVEEMNLQEMENVDGGSIWGWIGAALVVIGVLTLQIEVAAFGMIMGMGDAYESSIAERE